MELARWMMTAMCDWGVSREEILRRWTFSYLRLMQRTWNQRARELSEGDGGTRERTVSDVEMLQMLGV